MAPGSVNVAPDIGSAPALVYMNPEFMEEWAEFIVQQSLGPTAFVGLDGKPLDNQPSVNPSIAFWQRPIAFGDEPKSYIDIRRFLPIEVCIDMDLWWRLRGLEQDEKVGTHSYNQLMMHFGLEYRLMVREVTVLSLIPFQEWVDSAFRSLWEFNPGPDVNVDMCRFWSRPTKIDVTRYPYIPFIWRRDPV
ncbi:hypothetical protein S7711_10338 [Stachybotrys chartarum IBT 7711]|uniref:Uncharacterized protein n=1 Tax=Stachybotrys chartarum (strain CBS 109288 / IBT 7711) TaxID=1280523 RepID=A0A084B3I8_STACB|nr:hypothetical protein S7711_10338 [Stachybotrys chartarum IBT 7711]KFA77319.1 hypothetical protein S40288_10584 [Stachybotrys chartarum IBT 40288]